jgi:hypothetical protein
MADPPTRTRPIKESAPDIVTGQDKPSFQQFRLKVDGQTKDSFTTIEAAEKAALKIKQAHPVVQVSVYDSIEGRQIIIEAEKA